MSCQRSFFLELPTEIRIKIYHHLFSSSLSIRLIDQTKLRLKTDQETHLKPSRRLSKDPPYPPQNSNASECDYGWADTGPDHDIDTMLISRSWHEDGRQAERDQDRPYVFDVVPWGKQFPELPIDSFLLRSRAIMSKSAYLLSPTQDSRYWSASGKYTLFALERPNIGLLAVSRQIYYETYSLFFSLSTFILDGGAMNDLLFLSELPQRYRCLLRKITITAPVDYYSDRPWRMDANPHNLVSPIPIFTCFAAFIASNLPVLDELAIEYQVQRVRDFPCIKAHKELLKLLRLGRIKSLKFIVTGCSRNHVEKFHTSSEMRYKDLLQSFRRVPLQVAAQEYAFTHPPPPFESPEMEVWEEEVKTWLRRKNRKVVRWRWGDRDVDFGGCSEWQTLHESYRKISGYGDVQGVIEFFVEDRSKPRRVVQS